MRRTPRRRNKTARKGKATGRRMSKKAMRRSTKKRPKKKTKRKGKQKLTDWQKHVMAVHKSMKAKDPSIKGLGPAMKAAKKTYKKKSRPLSMSVDGGGSFEGMKAKWGQAKEGYARAKVAASAAQGAARESWKDDSEP